MAMPHIMDSPVLIKIRAAYPDLNQTGRKIADHILSHSERVVYGNLAQSSQAAGVSEASFVRFCKSLGYAGFTELRVSLAATVGRKAQEISDDFHLDRNTPLSDIPGKVIARTIHAMEGVLAIMNKGEYQRAVDALHRCSRIAIFAAANAASVADDAVNKLLRLGKVVGMYSDPHLQLPVAAAMTRRDVVIGISHSGRTRSTVDALRCAKKAGATVICITNREVSTITGTADIKLCTADDEKDFKSETMVSRLSQLAIIDMLFLGLMLQDYDRYQRIIEKQNEALAPLAY